MIGAWPTVTSSGSRTCFRHIKISSASKDMTTLSLRLTVKFRMTTSEFFAVTNTQWASRPFYVGFRNSATSAFCILEEAGVVIQSRLRITV